MNNPRQRYITHLQSFETRLQQAVVNAGKQKLQKLGELLHSADARTPMFQLQGLARIDAKIGKDKNEAEFWLSEFKSIEDALGKYDYWNAMIQNNQTWKFPREVSAYFEKEAAFWLGILEERLLRAGWIEMGDSGIEYSSRAMKNLMASLKKADFWEPEKEKKKLAEFMRNEAISIHDKVKKKEIDLNELEEGIHEFRRRIRWLGIYSSALLGKVRIAEHESNSPLAHFVTKENEAVKFNQLPFHKSQKAPVYFIRGGYYAMSDLISRIGKMKDPGLATEELLLLGKNLRLNASRVKKHLGKDFYPPARVIKDAKSLIDNFLFRENLLLHIAEYFDRNN